MTDDKPRTMKDIIDQLPWSYSVVLEILERADGHPNGDTKSFYDPAEDASERWVVFAALSMAAWPHSLLEYGTGIGWAWLTGDGKRLLAWLREYGCDDDKWPMLADDGRYYTEAGPVARDWNQGT